MDVDVFREALLSIMDRKDHWAWPAFTSGLVPHARLHIHLEQEYATYVRDFPVLVARAYVQCPIAEVRRELVENVYEEETGRIAAGRPHPELFLEVPRGLGMDLGRFARVELLPGAAAFRGFLDDATEQRGWAVAAAVTTLFLEGTRWERGEIDPRHQRRPEPPLDRHPLVLYYGLPVECLSLTRAHRSVEGSHRAAAWRMLLGHMATAEKSAVLDAMREALRRWLAYRDDVAMACGVERADDGTPRRAA